MRTIVFVTILPLFLSYRAHAVGLAADIYSPCANQVVLDETSNLSLALETLFNGEFARENDSHKFNNEFEKMEAQYFEQISHIRDHIGLIDVNYLPATFWPTYSAGLRYRRKLDWNQLVGRAVTGFQDSREVRNYFAGTVKNVEQSGQQLKLTLVASDGIERELNFKLDFLSRPDAQIFILLDSPQAEEQIFREAIRAANFEKIMTEAFGSPLEKSDYEMANAIVETFLHIPPNWGPASVLKIILGRNIEGGKNFTYYGLARDKTRHNEASLRKLIGPIYAFMKATKVIEPNRFPYWFAKFDRTARAPLFENYWHDLRRKSIPQI
jgi:hypothetical protein